MFHEPAGAVIQHIVAAANVKDHGCERDAMTASFAASM
jgi:hypothetical protein